MFNAGEPPIAPSPMNALIGDAYAVQHPGTPSDQAVQSVAVHLLVLYGVFQGGVEPADALWIRRRALRVKKAPKRGRFVWLDPPAFEGSLAVSHIAQAPDPVSCAGAARVYVEQTWALWYAKHDRTISAWYDAFVVPDGL